MVTTGAIVRGDAIVPLRADRWLGTELLGFVRVDDGWLATTTSGRTTFVWRTDSTGVVTDVEDLGSVRDVAVTQRGGERAVVWRDESGLQLRAGGVTRLVLPAPPGSGWLRPQALLAASDGYWLVATEEWVDAHFRASPTQLRIVHVGRGGDVLGELRVAPRGWLASVTAWLEDDALRLRLEERDGTRVVGVAPRTCEAAPRVDACAPRTWRPGATPLTGHHWAHEGEGLDYRDGPDVLWTLPLPGERLFMPLVSEDGTVAGLLRDEAGVRLVSLDPRTGARLAERSLGERTIAHACASPDLDHLALLDDTGATLLDREGRSVLHVEGRFAGCALAPLRDRLAWALERIEALSSAGPLTTVELLVLSRDGHERLVHAEPQQYGRRVELLATSDGTWLGWAGLGIGTYWIWPLDTEGVPIAEPHRVADLRLLPATTLALTELGPSLLWSSTQEEGVVPLCHVAEGPGESGLVSATYPVSR